MRDGIAEPNDPVPDSNNDRTPEDPRERNLSYDRGSNREWSLSEGQYDREFEKMANDFGDWAEKEGYKIDDSSGGRGKTNRINSDWNFAADGSENVKTSPWGLTNSRDWIGMAHYSLERGFNVTSTIGGSHNVGSQHYDGQAIDVSVRNKTSAEVDQFIKDARAAGYKVRDERVKPDGQKVWGGPHLHLSTPRNHDSGGLKATRNINKDSNTVKDPQSKEPNNKFDLIDNVHRIPLL